MSKSEKQEKARVLAIENRFYQTVTKPSAIEGDRMAIEWALKFQHNQAVAFSIAKTGDRNDRMAIEMAIENGTKKAAIEPKNQ